MHGATTPLPQYAFMTWWLSNDYGCLPVDRLCFTLLLLLLFIIIIIIIIIIIGNIVPVPKHHAMNAYSSLQH
jgi:hypothetical protein